MALDPRKAVRVSAPERRDRSFLTRARVSKRLDPDFSTLSVYIRKETHKKFKAKAAVRDIDMSDVTELLLAKWVAGEVSIEN